MLGGGRQGTGSWEIQSAQLSFWMEYIHLHLFASKKDFQMLYFMQYLFLWWFTVWPSRRGLNYKHSKKWYLFLWTECTVNKVIVADQIFNMLHINVPWGLSWKIFKPWPSFQSYLKKTSGMVSLTIIWQLLKDVKDNLPSFIHFTNTYQKSAICQALC